MEFAHLPEYMLICLSYIFKIIVLPKFIPIAEFNVCKSFLMVVVQRLKKEILIISKIICPTIVTSVTIAEKNEFRGVIKWNFLR